MEDWKKDVVHEYKKEGTLKLDLCKHYDKVDDDGVEQVIAG